MPCAAQQMAAVFRTQRIFKIVFELVASSNTLRASLICDNGKREREHSVCCSVLLKSVSSWLQWSVAVCSRVESVVMSVAQRTAGMHTANAGKQSCRLAQACTRSTR